MRISIEKKLLADAVHTVARFAQKSGATLPALSSILIIAGDDGIKLRATNLDVGIDYKLHGESKAEGVAAVPAMVLQQIASSLTGEGMVILERTGDILTLSQPSGKSSIKTIPYDDFPNIPFPENTKHRIVLPGTALRTLLTSIASCASTSTVRPELASILFNIEGGTVTTVATDSFRLAEKKVPLATKGEQGRFLIPAKNANEIAQALPDTDVIIAFDEHQCAFVSDQATLVSRLTAAAYPDYHQIIPKDSVVEAVVLKKDFESALKRATVFSDTFQKVQLSFDVKNKSLSLFAKNNDIGESAERITGQISGTSLDLSFNHRYLMAALALTSADSITLTAAGVGRPLLIRGVGDASLLYLVSPMNQ